MKITFVFLAAESFGIQAISSYVKEYGHETALAFDPGLFDDKLYFNSPRLHKLFDRRKGLIKDIVESKPDVVGLSVYADNYRWALSVARDVKKVLNVPVIFGGIHPTSVPDEVIAHDCVDMVCVGEGEEAVRELLDSMGAGAVDTSIKNIWFKQKDGTIIKNPVRPLVDINAMPLWDKSLFEGHVQVGKYYLTMTTRGCPYACTYCSQNFMRRFNKGYDKRRYTVDRIMRELTAMRDKYNFKEVVFYDSVLTVNKQWTLELMDRYKKEIGLPFRAISHVLCVDEDIARALKEAGCHRVQMGIQSLNERTRREFLKRPETNEQISRALNACDRVGLHYSCDQMFGLPQETEEDQLAAARFYSNLKKCVRVTCFWTTYFAGTELVDVARKLNLLCDNDVAAINRGENELYLDGGSVPLDQKKKVYKKYEMFFRMLPILPRGLAHYILDRRIHNWFNYLPRGITLFTVDFFVTIATRDLSAYQYISYYGSQMTKLLFPFLRRKPAYAQS